MDGAATTGPAPSRGRFWAFVPAGLLVSLIGFQLVLVRGALTDPSFAIEDDYYQKAVSWDAKMAQDRENARLAWKTSVEFTSSDARTADVTVGLIGSNGTPVAAARIDIEAFPIARSAHPLHASLREVSPGRYSGALPAARMGQWELRVRAQRGSDVFTSVIRRDLVPGGHRP